MGFPLNSHPNTTPLFRYLERLLLFLKIERFEWRVVNLVMIILLCLPIVSVCFGKKQEQWVLLTLHPVSLTSNWESRSRKLTMQHQTSSLSWVDFTPHIKHKVSLIVVEIFPGQRNGTLYTQASLLLRSTISVPLD